MRKTNSMVALLILMFISVGVQAEYIDTHGVLRSDDGSILLLPHSKAMKACPKGSHLITVRELAEIAQTRGAAGIVEVEDYDPKMKNFKMISATTSSGDREVFYYGYAGYQRPSGDLGLMFWSSSLDWDNKKKVYSIDNDGFIYNGILPTNYLGVMCVRDQSH